MLRLRTIWLAVLVASLTAIPAAAQGQRNLTSQSATQNTGSTTPVLSVYALSDFSDASFAQWVSETVPQVIQPQSWRNAGGVGVLSYHAPSRVLVVYQVPQVQAQVDEFLTNARKAQGSPVSAGRSVKPAADVLRAQHTAPGVLQAVDAVPVTPAPVNPYPVPPQTKQPKHLFHFIIRYEGEGLIDSNVVDFFKYYGDNAGETRAVRGPETNNQPIANMQPIAQAGYPIAVPPLSAMTGILPTQPGFGPIPQATVVAPMPPADGHTEPSRR